MAEVCEVMVCASLDCTENVLVSFTPIASDDLWQIQGASAFG